MYDFETLTAEQEAALINCEDTCRLMDDYYKLTAAMLDDILTLEEDLVRWRKALVPHLNARNAEGLQMDILDGMARSYEGMPAYDHYVKCCCNGKDPQQDTGHCRRIRRLKNGTDETSVFLD